MWTDPILDEVRTRRREIAAEAGNDLDEICRRAREHEVRLGPRVAEPHAAASASTGLAASAGFQEPPR